MPEVLLGFDFGMKHIGVAVGQSMTGSATPITTLNARDGIPDWKAVDLLVKEWRPSALVVGIPLNMDETEQPITLCARRFAERLEAHCKLKVIRVDERLSSWEAEQRRKNQPGINKNQDLHALSAAILIEQYLNDSNSIS